MARTVHGKIADKQGKPAKGLKVEAWDDDWPGSDQRMGWATTDAKGWYELQYCGGHWDPAPHSITTWRPDIYITVSISNRAGRWVTLAKSRVYKNHKLRKDKRIDLKVDLRASVRGRTTFSVARHGFRFANSFVVSDIVPGIDGPFQMGFCGGMSAGALHRFQHGCARPATTSTPQENSPLYKELLERQIATLPVGVVTKIYDWQRSPDQPHVHTPHSIRYRQKSEWGELKKEIDQKRPAILVLIRAEGYFADITRNHQVLAFGYEYNPTTRDLKVEVYDPNDRNGTNYLYLCLGGGRLKAQQIDSSGKAINFRGFFVNSAGPDAARKHYS